MYIGLLEDEPHLAQHVCEILEGAGHTVIVFNNGADMVRAIGRDTIDLFVLDWRVPRLSGLSEETNHSSEVAEMTLAHAISNKVEAAYRRGSLLNRRRLLMTDWESYCLTPTKVAN